MTDLGCRNSTSRGSEKVPAMSSMVGDAGDQQRDIRANKQDALKNLPPKNILQKRYYSTNQLCLKD